METAQKLRSSFAEPAEQQDRYELALLILQRLLMRADPASKDWPYAEKKNPVQQFAECFRIFR